MSELKFKGGEAKVLELEEGKQIGKIKVIIVEIRNDYKYLDFFLELNWEKGELKASYPAPGVDGISPNSLLGGVLKEFTGSEVEKNKDYDLDKLLVGKPCSFLVKKDGTDCNVIRDTLKPVDGGQ